MKISKVEILPIQPRQGLIGFATLEVDEQLVLSSIAIHCKRDGSGFRLTYPTKNNGQHKMTLFHPTNLQLSREIERAIFDKAQKILIN